MHLKYMIYWFSTVNCGLKTFPKPSFEKGEAWFIWAGHCPVCPAWTLTGLAEFKSNYHFCTEPARMFEAIMKRGVCFKAVGYTLPLIVRQKNIILQSFCLNNLNLTQKAWCLSNFVTPIHSVRCLLVWNKIFCDAPNISSTVVNIYQMGGRLGDNFLHHWQIIVGLFDCDTNMAGWSRALQVGSASYIWHMVTFMYKFRSTMEN